MRPDLDDLQGVKKFSPTRAFGASKAGNLLLTFALARRLEETGITVNAYHPGIVRTKLMRDAPLPMRLMSGALNRLRGRSPEAAGEELADMALSPSYDLMTGRLFHRGRPIRAPFEDDYDLQERLWEESERIAGLKDRRD